MLKLSKDFTNRPILSLRIGGQVATANDPIINPDNLKLEGWFCQDIRSKEDLVLQEGSVRDIVPDGIVVNDIDELTQLEELVRLKKIVDLKFTLIGKQVVTETKQKVGKVEDYAIEPTTMMIKKLYIHQNILKDFSGGGRVIDRNQIIEVTDRKIVVRGTDIRITTAVAQPAAEPA